MEWVLLAISITAVFWLKINYRKTDGPHSWPVTVCLATLYLVMLSFPVGFSEDSYTPFFVRTVIAAWLCWELVGGHLNTLLMRKYAEISCKDRTLHDNGIIWAFRVLMVVYGISLWNILTIPTQQYLEHTLRFFVISVIPSALIGYALGMLMHKLCAAWYRKKAVATVVDKNNAEVKMTKAAPAKKRKSKKA